MRFWSCGSHTAVKWSGLKQDKIKEYMVHQDDKKHLSGLYWGHKHTVLPALTNEPQQNFTNVL